MKQGFLIIISSFLWTFFTEAQNTLPWGNKKAAVVITYDDAINQHLDNAIPVLDSLGLKATFYVIATTGHELGNHTLYHPCVGGKGREWVRPEYDLRNYTVQRMLDETRMTNLFLRAMDGKTK